MRFTRLLIREYFDRCLLDHKNSPRFLGLYECAIPSLHGMSLVLPGNRKISPLSGQSLDRSENGFDPARESFLREESKPEDGICQGWGKFDLMKSLSGD
jgi:hypothetical protein